MKNYLFILIILSLVSACTDTGDSKEINFIVNERMAMFYRAQDSICRTLAFNKAEQAVDSFFLTIRQQYLHDSIAVPVKPIKPIVDTHITLDVALPVKPLWDSLKFK